MFDIYGFCQIQLIQIKIPNNHIITLWKQLKTAIACGEIRGKLKWLSAKLLILFLVILALFSTFTTQKYFYKHKDFKTAIQNISSHSRNLFLANGYSLCILCPKEMSTGFSKRYSMSSWFDRQTSPIDCTARDHGDLSEPTESIL